MAKKMGRRRAKKEPRFADGDVFTIPLGDGRAYLAWAIASPSYVDTYIVVFDFITDEKQAESRVDEALASQPLLAGIAILPAGAESGEKCSLVGHRDLTTEDKNRFFPAIFSPSGLHSSVEDIYGQRNRPVLPNEKRVPVGPNIDENYQENNPGILFIPSMRSYSFMSFVSTLKAISGMIPWEKWMGNLYADKVVLAKDVLGPLGPGS